MKKIKDAKEVFDHVSLAFLRRVIFYKAYARLTILTAM